MLCVDNDPESRVALATALAEHQVAFVSNAFEALSRLNTRGFHGYVLDYWLPDLSGPSLCLEIRKLDPHAPVVFCTSAARPEYRARAIRAGASGYLTKPVDPSALKEKLRRCLSMADVESVRARIEEQRAIQEELERRVAQVRERSASAAALAAQSLERTARTRAFKAFIEARGTRAHFERWWPQVFQSTRASHQDPE